MAIRSSSSSLLSNLRKYHSKTPSFISFSRASFSSSSPGSVSLITNHIVEEPENQENDDNLKTRLLKLRFPKRSATTAIQNWINEGNRVTLPEFRQLAKDLNKSHRFKHALEISEWIVTRKEFELSDTDYATRINLMTKVFGVDSAERYFEGLPQAAKTGETYTALLHSYASAKLTDRAESFFERIQRENVCVSTLAYNEMMTLYVSVGQLEKVSLVIEEMKRQNVSRDLYSYNLWISSCAGCMDIDSVRRILDEMSCDCNSKEGWVAYRQLTDIYITVSNLVNSADENSLVEAERKISQREWITYDFLIILYTGLRYKERIDAIWKSLKLTAQKMTSRNYMCILSSYVMLGEFKEAGGVLDEWKQSKSVDFDAKQCRKLVDAFAGAGLVEKAELLRTLMIQKDCNPVEESD
ncbi:hypothetical protein MKW92_036728 [Papaver armeniacum]|nr:hypothetical protein MKW92_036728 [Papaver armeniacum]